jgi:hypothetical protein
MLRRACSNSAAAPFVHRFLGGVTTEEPPVSDASVRTAHVAIREVPASEYSDPPERSRYSDWLRAGRPRGPSSSPDRGENFLHVVQTGSGAYPASFPMGIGESFPWG